MNISLEDGEIEKIAEVILIVAYGDLYYTDEKPHSFLSIPGAKEVGVEIYSLSKTFNMAGWRSAFTVGNESIIRYLGSYLQNAVGGVFGNIQDASAFALSHQSAERAALREQYKKEKALLGIDKKN
ncbi:aminotransferase class I/II-fold pyridoxal phosphate-dependent enzyme [Bacillus sp. B1-b2]|uniref:aminotransferase class I/II-fold pyridoxal phosphate-dependent enzyme n=1 Tax=Bacillus sp. B1-b2 TaxID=2653201 RepID=UPI001261EA1E|nr:aminotransferase class I/II-fold pyridoxal phosphate-dependent enzyme [Bacillus sp. B1-b2]KAB7667732.1 aminotransferase class I/II-fold pyridoxal phosphate-dependent enzyme [Bacillus sp. B1-b2]